MVYPSIRRGVPYSFTRSSIFNFRSHEEPFIRYLIHEFANMSISSKVHVIFLVRKSTVISFEFLSEYEIWIKKIIYETRMDYEKRKSSILKVFPIFRDFYIKKSRYCIFEKKPNQKKSIEGFIGLE